MRRIWETAVAAALRDAGIPSVLEQPEYSNHFVQQRGAPTLTVGIKPDIVLGPRTAPKLVIDLKWAPALQWHRNRKRLRNQHLYQLAAYCTALGCDGALIYPRMDDDVDSIYEFNGHQLSVRTVGLREPRLGDLQRAAANLRPAAPHVARSTESAAAATAGRILDRP